MNLDYTSGFATQLNSALDRLQRTQEVALKEAGSGMDRMHQALQIETAMRAKEDYEREMRPLKLEKYMATIPKYLQNSMLKVMQNGNLIQGNPGNEYIITKDAKHLGESINKSPLLQASILSWADQEQEQKLAGTKQKLAGMTKEANEYEAFFNGERKKLQEEAAKTGYLNKDKENALNEKIEKHKQEKKGLYEGITALQNEIIQSEKDSYTVKQQMNMIDDGYKKDVEKYGLKDAMLLKHLDDLRPMMELKRKKLEKQASNEAALDQQNLLLPGKILEKKIEAGISFDKEAQLARLKEGLRKGRSEEEKPMKEKDVLAKLISLDKAIDAAKRNDPSALKLLLAAKMPESFTPSDDRTELIGQLNKYRDFYAGKLKPETKKLFEKEKTVSSAGNPADEAIIKQAKLALQDKVSTIPKVRAKLREYGYTEEQLNNDPAFKGWLKSGK